MSDDRAVLLQERLARYRAHLGMATDHGERLLKRRETPPSALAESDGVTTVERRFSLSDRHGRYRLGQFRDAVSAWQTVDADHPLSAPHLAAEDLLFFDTETTGLHHGAGTLIFLLGYARLLDEAIVVRQHFLASPAAEKDLYATFLEGARGGQHLVTYNGKAFDWPLVCSRHALLRREVPDLPNFGHFDLLPACRRLWESELPSCRLAVVEREKLEVIRVGDIPGSMAPAQYFAYLRKQDFETIRPVLAHNVMDVLSLITLYTHLSVLIAGYRRREGITNRERMAVSRWYESLGQWALAGEGYQIVAESAGPWQLAARVALGRCLKRQGDWQGSLSTWEACLPHLQVAPTREAVLVEVAKIYEHRLGDNASAYRYACQARDAWRAKWRALRQPPASPCPHDRRLARLQAKLGCQGSVEQGGTRNMAMDGR